MDRTNAIRRAIDAGAFDNLDSETIFQTIATLHSGSTALERLIAYSDTSEQNVYSLDSVALFNYWFAPDGTDGGAFRYGSVRKWDISNAVRLSPDNQPYIFTVPAEIVPAAASALFQTIDAVFERSDQGEHFSDDDIIQFSLMVSSIADMLHIKPDGNGRSSEDFMVAIQRRLFRNDMKKIKTWSVTSMRPRLNSQYSLPASLLEQYNEQRAMLDARTQVLWSFRTRLYDLFNVAVDYKLYSQTSNGVFDMKKDVEIIQKNADEVQRSLIANIKRLKDMPSQEHPGYGGSYNNVLNLYGMPELLGVLKKYRSAPYEFTYIDYSQTNLQPPFPSISLSEAEDKAKAIRAMSKIRHGKYTLEQSRLHELSAIESALRPLGESAANNLDVAADDLEKRCGTGFIPGRPRMYADATTRSVKGIGQVLGVMDVVGSFGCAVSQTVTVPSLRAAAFFTRFYLWQRPINVFKNILGNPSIGLVLKEQLQNILQSLVPQRSTQIALPWWQRAIDSIRSLFNRMNIFQQSRTPSEEQKEEKKVPLPTPQIIPIQTNISGFSSDVQSLYEKGVMDDIPQDNNAEWKSWQAYRLEHGDEDTRLALLAVIRKMPIYVNRIDGQYITIPRGQKFTRSIGLLLVAFELHIPTDQIIVFDPFVGEAIPLAYMIASLSSQTETKCRYCLSWEEMKKDEYTTRSYYGYDVTFHEDTGLYIGDVLQRIVEQKIAKNEHVITIFDPGAGVGNFGKSLNNLLVASRGEIDEMVGNTERADKMAALLHLMKQNNISIRYIGITDAYKDENFGKIHWEIGGADQAFHGIHMAFTYSPKQRLATVLSAHGVDTVDFVYSAAFYPYLDDRTAIVFNEDVLSKLSPDGFFATMKIPTHSQDALSAEATSLRIIHDRSSPNIFTGRMLGVIRQNDTSSAVHPSIQNTSGKWAQLMNTTRSLWQKPNLPNPNNKISQDIHQSSWQYAQVFVRAFAGRIMRAIFGVEIPQGAEIQKKAELEALQRECRNVALFPTSSIALGARSSHEQSYDQHKQNSNDSENIDGWKVHSEFTFLANSNAAIKRNTLIPTPNGTINQYVLSTLVDKNGDSTITPKNTWPALSQILESRSNWFDVSTGSFQTYMMPDRFMQTNSITEKNNLSNDRIATKKSPRGDFGDSTRVESNLAYHPSATITQISH